ncbi:MAG TPA: polysaccharide biosynthesis tyrosine autokinase [Thermomicrobiales bacterium]
MEVDLRQVLRSLRRWWWVAVAGPLLFGCLAYVYSARQEPRYAAEATLLINPSASSGTLDYNSVLTAERLAKTYQKLATSRTVLEAVVASLQLPTDADDLSKQVRASADGETQLLTIRVSDTNPEQAASLANAIAEQFQLYLRDQTSQTSAETQQTVDQTIRDLETQIEETEAQIEALQQRSDADTPAVQAEIASLMERLNNLQGTYGKLLALAAELRTNTAVAADRVTVAVAAVPPSAPYAPKTAVNVLFGIIAGGIIAGGVILLLTYLDNTVKPSLDFQRLVEAPLLSTVARISKLAPGRSQLFVLESPKGGAAEAIRLLRTNIEFASATREIAILGVSSANPGEGKSTIAANLAVTLAQAGFVTALVDADLRRPAQHRIFGGGTERGLSTLLSSPERPWSWAAQATMVPNLTLIPAGPLPPNPADLLSLERMRELLAELREAFDVIVIDMPPILAVSDPLIVAAHVDGMVLVSRSGKTRTDALRRAAETLQRGAIRLVGVIVNQQAGRDRNGYYYTEYHASKDSPRGPRSSRRRSGATTPATVGPAEQTPAH